MRSILWASILASALVAVVTTLLVEYLAKPSLEARKERILADKRRQRDALSGLVQCLHLIGLLSGYRDYRKDLESDKDALGAMNTEVNKDANDIIELIRTAFIVITVPDWMQENWSATTAAIAGFSTILSVREPDECSWRRFEANCFRLIYFAEFLTTSKRHLWRRRKLIREINSLNMSARPTR